MARRKDRSLSHSCEGSDQLVPRIDLFSRMFCFQIRQSRNIPFLSHTLCIHMHVDARERARAGKVWSEGASGEWDWRETHTSRVCEAHVLSTKISIMPAPRTLQNRLRKVRLFCSLRGLLTKYSDLNEILS